MGPCPGGLYRIHTPLKMEYDLDGQSSARLTFRHLSTSDFGTWLPFHKDKRTSQFWSGLPASPKTACQQQFARTFERYDEGLGGLHVISLGNSEHMVGLAGLLVQDVFHTTELEIAYYLLPEYWGKGLASEAAEHCKKVAFQQSWAESLISIIQVDNLPSQKVALATGMHISATGHFKDNKVHIFRINK